MTRLIVGTVFNDFNVGIFGYACVMCQSEENKQ